MLLPGSVQYNGGFLPDIILLTESILPPLGNPMKCHEEVSSLQPAMFSPKRFDNFYPRLADPQKV